MDAVDLLRRQHRELEAGMAQILDTEDAAEIQTKFRRVADLLTVHIASEEEIFYPAVKQKRTEDILLESLEEHLSLKRLLADLLALDCDAKNFEAKFHVLKEQSEHHHKEEEENLFPKVCKLIDAEARKKLGNEMLDLQERLAAEGQPRKRVVNETDSAAPL